MTTMPMETLLKKPKLFDPFKVLLHNDDVNDMGHVVQSLTKSVPQLSKQQALDIMKEAHQHGVALVVTCPQEHAEMYRDNLQSCGLVSSIEKDV